MQILGLFCMVFFYFNCTCEITDISSPSWLMTDYRNTNNLVFLPQTCRGRFPAVVNLLHHWHTTQYTLIKIQEGKSYTSSDSISIHCRTALLPTAEASFFSGWLGWKQNFYIFWPCWSGRGQTFKDLFLKYIQWVGVSAVAGFNNSINCICFLFCCFVS